MIQTALSITAFQLTLCTGLSAVLVFFGEPGFNQGSFNLSLRKIELAIKAF